MQLARSFAERTDCPVMRYLANAQFLGLVGLWKKLCAGQLPARCTKEWFFETFCGEDAGTFARSGRDALDERSDIDKYLTGHVKPYDVLALMTVLPQTEAHFVRPAVLVPETALLLLTAEDAVPVEHVLNFLRDTYHEVVLATVGGSPGASLRQHPRHASAAALAPSWRLLSRTPEISPQLRGEFGVSTAGPKLRCPETLRTLRQSTMGAEPLAPAEIARVLANHLGLARAQQQMVTWVATVGGLCLFVAGLGALLVDDAMSSKCLQPGESSWRDAGFSLRTYVYLLLSILACCVLCFSLIPTAASIVRARVVVTVIGIVGLSVGTTSYVAEVRALFDVVAYAEPDRPLVLFAIEKAYYACRVAQWVGIPLVLLGRMVVTWRRPRALVAAVLTAAGTLFVCQSILDAALVGLLLGRVVLREHPPWLLAGIVVFSLLEFAIGCAMLSKNALLNGRALIVSFKLGVRCQCGREEVGGGGGNASLAPLLGFGTLREREPHELVQEAGRAFVPLVASEQSLRALGPKALFCSAEARDDSQRGRRVFIPSTAGVRRILPLANDGAGHAMSHASQVGHATPRALQVDCATLRAPHYAIGSAEPDAATSLQPMASAEYYVVHGRYDDLQAKLDALAIWVTEFECAHDGRSPSIFISGVCAGISPVEQLEHMPICVARSKRLLILAGPGLPAQLWCAMECYTWFALGGCIENVEVAIVVTDAGSIGSVVSAFDAFHVMYSLSDGDTAAQRQLMAAIELAGIAQFNGTLRELMPRVKAAADRLIGSRLSRA
ncbi:hypothetical protein T492DRAFT_956006 [Pavlovales sp. CCMP2436]|nr:hypothetical protein T492DRAFT_956006 [Pavlovales sp. CCMP2436]